MRARGHFPNETAALKCVYLTVRSLDPTGTGRQRWMNRWKQPLNAFAVAFEDRILNATKYNDHDDQFHRISDSHDENCVGDRAASLTPNLIGSRAMPWD